MTRSIPSAERHFSVWICVRRQKSLSTIFIMWLFSAGVNCLELKN